MILKLDDFLDCLRLWMTKQKIVKTIQRCGPTKHTLLKKILIGMNMGVYSKT